MNEILKFLEVLRVDHLLAAVLVLLLARLLFSWVQRALDRLAERYSSRRLLFKQAGAFAGHTLFLLGLAVALNLVLDFSAEKRLVAAGLLALLAIFAFKDLLGSFAAGLTLLADRTIRVGDRIAFQGEYGEVVKIGLRTVRIQTLDDNLVSIPNHLFLSHPVASANAGALDQMCVFRFYIGCNEDFDTARRIVHEATASSQYVYLGKPIKVLLKEGPVPGGAERFATHLTVKAYVLDGRYEKDFETDVTERVKRAFRERGIRSAGDLEWTRLTAPHST
jgi:small-conductance mechanosensitive channel